MYNDYNFERLKRTKEEIENLMNNYKGVAPVNNFYSTQQKEDMYVIKKLNDNDEAENILIGTDTIFLGTNRMQIKKVDGTIQKFNIDQYYPIDEKDEMIKELNKKVEELERKLNDEPNKHIKSNEKCNKSNANDDGNVESESTTNDESI